MAEALAIVRNSNGSSATATALITVTYPVDPVDPVPPPNPANTITLSSPTGAAVTNYPFQIGRPFIAGEIPHFPQCLVDGVPASTQADVKHRYPDGSVQYAVIAVVIPAIPASGVVTLSFADQPSGNNTPLTKEQMLDPQFNFDARMNLSFPALVRGVPNSRLATWKAITDGSLALTIDGTAYQITGVDLSAITDLNGVTRALRAAWTAAGIPAVLDSSLNSYVPYYTQITATGADAKIMTVTTPTSGTNLAPLLFATGKKEIASSIQTASARNMLQAGDYKLWTSGPIAQTIELADDTTARKYDLGNGDGYHPFRPRIYATFCSATGQVRIRFVGENGLTTEIEDLSYKLSLALGDTSPATVYSIDLTGTQATQPKKHWALTNITKSFWLGGTPEPKINIDHNLAYLASTRYFPNFDASVTIAPATLTQLYGYWTSKPNDLYDGTWNGKGLWNAGMGDTGGRMDIAPYPAWSVLWMYTGDWRMRTVALGMADNAGAWAVHLRESDPARRLSRDDAVGSGTGLGRVMSITDRPTIYMTLLTYAYTTLKDRVTIVGPMRIVTDTGWQFDQAHEPSPFYPQYILTGDPHYLNQMYYWASRDTGVKSGSDSIGRISDQLRGAAWVVRNRAETAFAAPDDAPEKHYFTYLTNDALARWESGFLITGTPFDGTVAKHGVNFYTLTGDAYQGLPTLIHIWQAKDAPAGVGTAQPDDQFHSGGLTRAGSSPWQTWYLLYSLGRMTELGFAARPLFEYSGKFLTGMVTVSGHPELIGAYYLPVEKPIGGYMTWPEVVAAVNPTYLDHLRTYYTRPLNGEDYSEYLKGGAAMLVDAGVPDAVATWNGLKRIYALVGTWNSYQAVWNINPRTDNNVLPAMPTVIPPVP